MKWITRKNANVDRIACPWLIRRFIDPEAVFLFVPTDEVSAVAEREGAIPYDVKGIELGHVHGRCSLESILLKYKAEDPAFAVAGAYRSWGPISQPRSRSSQKPRGCGLLPTASQQSTAITIWRSSVETPVYDALYTWCQRRAAEVERRHGQG